MSGPAAGSASPAPSREPFVRTDLFASLVVSALYLSILAVLVFTTVL